MAASTALHHPVASSFGSSWLRISIEAAAAASRILEGNESRSQPPDAVLRAGMALGRTVRRCEGVGYVTQSPTIRLRQITEFHMPHTVTGAPVTGGATRRKIFSSQLRSGDRSNTIRWPASAPHRSM